MAHAYDNGINFFDNAEGYETGNAERVMGEALKALNWSRDSYAVSSKVFFGGNGKRRSSAACRPSTSTTPPTTR